MASIILLIRARAGEGYPLSFAVVMEMLLSDRRVELADLETVTQYVADLRNLLNDSTLAEKKSFIRSFISEVRVTGTEVLLAYNFPVSGGKLANETCVVPPIVHYGGR